eukprot:gene5966-biopygen8746
MYSPCPSSVTTKGARCFGYAMCRFNMVSSNCIHHLPAANHNGWSSMGATASSGGGRGAGRAGGGGLEVRNDGESSDTAVEAGIGCGTADGDERLMLLCCGKTECGSRRGEGRSQWWMKVQGNH